MTAREELATEIRLARLSLNSSYGKNPTQEMKRTAELIAVIKWNSWLLNYTETNTIGM